MATKAEKIVELSGIISNKSKRIKRLKLECGQQSTQICVLKLQIKELVHRWNAFEEGGLVFDLVAVCNALQIRIAFIGLPSEPMNKGGPDWSKEIALIEGILTKVKKGFEDGKSTKDDS